MKQKPIEALTVENVMRLAEVRRMTGLGCSTIYRLRADRQFPQSIKLSVRAVDWLEREVQEWLARRVAFETPPAGAGWIDEEVRPPPPASL